MPTRKQEWRPVVGWEEFYDVSSLGDVKRKVAATCTRAGRVLVGYINPDGYHVVSLSRPGVCVTRGVHVLVAAAFLGPKPSGQEIRHRNGRPRDNRVVNLAYGTRHENARDSVAHGTSTKGEKSGQAKLTRSGVTAIRFLASRGIPNLFLARFFAVSQAAISNVLSRKTWG